MTTLTKSQWQVVQRHFDELIALSPQQRNERIATLSIGTPLIVHLRALLAAADVPGVLDKSLPPHAVDDSISYSSLGAGARIGSFEIDRLIDRGGMGEVYEAHRTDADFEQRVALKMLRPEAAGQAGLFDRERRLLASLEHPGIARLIDGGIAPDGRPFMAMEFVEGQPIDLWCAAQSADLNERLRLFRDVCNAVSYAHARLVIHRDLKPANILVDQTGRARLLDFGIAKLLDDASAAASVTQAMLTPEYSSPEQLANAPATIATDVYGLGIILFELLVGRGPWHGDSGAMPTIVRRILNEDPALPSTVAQADGPVSARLIPGDLDAIVMKAMRRNPEERYQSASELSEDIARYQDIRPVHAREGSTRYMMGRFVRRYRWAVGASVAALAAVLIGAGGIAWQARQTGIERDIALSEARRSESINRMLTVMMRDTAASDAGETATVKQMLDQTAKNLVGSVDKSAKSATLITSLFDLYVNLEDSAGASALINEAVAKGIGADDSVSSAQIKMRQASSAAAMGKTDEMPPLLDAAEAVFRTDPDRFRTELVELNGDRAQYLRRTGKLEDAITLLRKTLPDANRVWAENHRDLLTHYNNLLVYMSEANQLDAMPAIFAEAYAVIKRTGQGSSMQGLTITQLKGVRLMKLDQFTQAETIFTRVVAQRRAVFGRSAGLSVDMLQLARTKIALGKFDEAQTLLSEARPMAAEKLSPSAPPTLFMGLGLAEAMAEGGNTAAADRVLDELSPMIDAIPKQGLPHGVLAKTRAIVRLKQGRRADARIALDQSETIFTAAGPSGKSYLKPFPKLRARIATGR